MKVGPSPSRASVEAGAVTQFWVKRLSPRSKSRRSSLVSLEAGRPKALRVASARVVSPPRSGAGPAGRPGPHPAAANVAAAKTAVRAGRRNAQLASVVTPTATPVARAAGVCPR